MEGYIKLWRKSQESPVWDNINLWRFWTWCLMKATYKARVVKVGYQDVPLGPGQFIFGRHKASLETKLSERTIRTCCRHLENMENLTIKATKRFSVITILNWEKYQEEATNDTTNKRPTSDQQATTNNKGKKEEKGKKGKEEDIYTLFDQWNDHKIVVHKKFTDKMKSSFLKALKDYSSEEIAQAIVNYTEVLHGDEYFFNYTWGVEEFLSKGLKKFTLPPETVRNNYKKNNHGNGHNDSPNYPDLSAELRRERERTTAILK